LTPKFSKFQVPPAERKKFILAQSTEMLVRRTDPDRSEKTSKATVTEPALKNGPLLKAGSSATDTSSNLRRPGRRVRGGLMRPIATRRPRAFEN
jgi:hypothetical protein